MDVRPLMAACVGILIAECSLGQGMPATPPQAVPGATRPSAPPVFDDKVSLGRALDSACATAKSDQTRVLLVLGTERQTFGTALRDVMTAFGVVREAGLEYEIVWASVGETGEGPVNAKLAKELGIELLMDGEDATLVVMDERRTLVAQANFATMRDAIRKRSYSSTKVGDFLTAHRAPKPVAQEKLNAALESAKSGGRGVLLTFGSFDDPWSAKWRRVLADPKSRAIIEKVAVVSDVELVRDKDAYALLEKYGGKMAQTMPWFVLLDASGAAVAASQTEKTPNIGFPSQDDEIETFLKILDAGQKKLSPEDQAGMREVLIRERNLP